jgi:hypothetical protein
MRISFENTFISALATAALSFVSEALGLFVGLGSAPYVTFVLYVSLALSALWLAIVIYAIVTFRRRGLWSMVGLPLVVFWPYMVTALSYSCSTGQGCL